MKIVGTGHSVPAKVVTNDDISQILDTSDEWIVPRTGIRERRVATTETTTSMAVDAAKKALDVAGMDATEIDVIICASITQDKILPSLSCEVQAELGAPQASAFDIGAACSGFIYALGIANGYLASAMYHNALIVGSETLSKLMNWQDRASCILFGDGAAAAVVTADGAQSMLAFEQGADGVRGAAIESLARPLSHPFLGDTPISGAEASPEIAPIDYIHMDGKDVYLFATRTLPKSINRVLDKAGVELSEIKYFLVHQANLRIIQMAARRLGADMDKFPINLDRYGNTSAASVGILLDEVVRAGKLEPGDKIIVSGFGGGLTWGTALIEWA